MWSISGGVHQKMTDIRRRRFSSDSTAEEARSLVSLTAPIYFTVTWKIMAVSLDMSPLSPAGTDTPPKKLEVTQTNSIWMTVVPCFSCAVIPKDCALPKLRCLLNEAPLHFYCDDQLQTQFGLNVLLSDFIAFVAFQCFSLFWVRKSTNGDHINNILRSLAHTSPSGIQTVLAT